MNFKTAYEMSGFVSIHQGPSVPKRMVVFDAHHMYKGVLRDAALQLLISFMKISSMEERYTRVRNLRSGWTGTKLNRYLRLGCKDLYVQWCTLRDSLTISVYYDPNTLRKARVIEQFKQDFAALLSALRERCSTEDPKKYSLVSLSCWESFNEIRGLAGELESPTRYIKAYHRGLAAIQAAKAAKITRR